VGGGVFLYPVARNTELKGRKEKEEWEKVRPEKTSEEESGQLVTKRNPLGDNLIAHPSRIIRRLVRSILSNAWVKTIYYYYSKGGGVKIQV